jgi:phospholipid/cholesterol/gamma-HCH transport system substrate-binding protein
MTRSPMRDLLVGLFVLVGLGAIAYLSFSVGGLSYSGPGGLTVYALFDQTGGLKPRAPVVLSGVKVGQVTAITLDKTFRARAALDLDASLRLPTDTMASIVTAGILGDRYVSLQLGGEEQLLKSGDTLNFTESALILENLIGKFMYGRSNGGSENGNGEQATPSGSPAGGTSPQSAPTAAPAAPSGKKGSGA